MRRVTSPVTGIGAWMLWGAYLLGVLTLGGCERKMLDHVCEPVSEGQLVISELRGPQSGTDTWGQWIEIHNDSNAPVGAGGLELRLTQLDGTSTVQIVVRDPDVTIEAGGYLVVGRFDDALRPDHIDYGYASDFDTDLYPDGRLELYVCGELMDTVIYHGLPGTGSLAFDGDEELTTVTNDDEGRWCNDASDIGGHPTEIGIPGTPGEQNRPCM